MLKDGSNDNTKEQYRITQIQISDQITRHKFKNKTSSGSSFYKMARHRKPPASSTHSPPLEL